MATSNFPSSLDTTSALPASISDTANLNSPNHAEMHEVYNDAIIEIEEKVGIGDTTPTTGAILIGTGTGQSAWDTTPTFTGLVTANGGLTVTGAVTLTGAVLQGELPLVFEGDSDNSYEATFKIEDPDDRDVVYKFPNLTTASGSYTEMNVAGRYNAKCEHAANIFTQGGQPSDDVSSNGDLWIDSDNNQTYYKTGTGTWTLIKAGSV